MRAGTTRGTLAAMCAFAVLLCSCWRSDSPPAAPGTPPPAAPHLGGASDPEIERSYSTECTFGVGKERCTVRLLVDDGVATVADRITIIMEADAPEDVGVHWPDAGGLFSETDVLTAEDESVVDPAATARRIERRVIVLEPFLPGDRNVPAMAVRFAGADGASCVINTDPFTISVTSLLGDAAAPEPELRGVVEPPPAPRAWWVWPLVIVGGLGVAAMAALALRRIRPRGAEPLTPYGEAMRRLKELENWPPPADHAGYAAALGETLRRYVAGVLHMEPKDRTTEELMSEITSAPSLNIASVRDVLARLDEVSFAGASVGAPEAQELRDRVYKLVMGIQAGYAAPAGGKG